MEIADGRGNSLSESLCHGAFAHAVGTHDNNETASRSHATMFTHATDRAYSNPHGYEAGPLHPPRILLMLPNFFLVGTTKGGTSSLDAWLRGHPDVATPERKEMHFFCKCPNPDLRVADTREEYLAAFPSGKAVGESSPCYLYYPDIPDELAAFPHARLIVSLRDPVERFWSHYLMNEIYRPRNLAPARLLAENLDSGRTNAIEDLYGMGLYGEQVERYLRRFDRERILVLFLEETSVDPNAAMDRIQSFLGLERIPLDTSARQKQHVEPKGAAGRVIHRNPTMRALGNRFLSSSARRVLKTRVLGDPSTKPAIPSEVAGQLRELYSPDARLLEELIERALPWGWHRP